MGIAIISGVIASLESIPSAREQGGHHYGAAKWESHTPGTLTPTAQSPSDESLPSRYLACVSREESAKRLRDVFFSLGGSGPSIEVLVGQNVRAVQEADVVILCCKPQLARSILTEPGLREALDGKLLISILAGVTIAQLTALVTAPTKVIRAMPNTPCRIREGMTVVTNLPQSDSSELDRAKILKIFSSIGRCRFLDEKHFDACTALSGSGPAFACIFLEAMADGGVMMGLPRAEALELAAQTLQGAARMTLQGPLHPAQLKDAVTSEH
ncbi:hypothetical protein EUX98_g271 [Antrodiella citrinella]|uniref:Pyrroline-5-carboxylate reductase n=1 Tax=Antrodiella citrinella TaxID=2447956 RepID=A0A4V6S1Z2_9APHY|nr:hypothetical protein EUX98_g271 [Antrodiella citrinella]